MKKLALIFLSLCLFSGFCRFNCIPFQIPKHNLEPYHEFQAGLKFRSAYRAEILLRLHAQFQPGRRTQISMRMFTEVRKHSRCAFLRSLFGPG